MLEQRKPAPYPYLYRFMMKVTKADPKSSYLDLLRAELQLPPPEDTAFLAIDLFAGCGGLALGFEAAGLRTVGYEMLPDACATYRQNLHGDCQQTTLTPETVWRDRPQAIIGGPPCQPFSVGGLQRGLKDSRDGFPIFINAVRRYRPAIAIFENVRGMLFRNRAYFNEIVEALQNLGYKVDWQLLNASHYGVPQSRERVFCVAHQGGWQWPPKISGKPYTAGEALGELALNAPPESKFLTPSMDAYIKKYELASKCVRPRDLHLDAPARTVTCRNLSAATGDMLRIRLPDGRRRRLTVREGARLQSFPDWFEFIGNAESQCRQIGNAVPPLLAKAIGLSVRKYLEPNNSKGLDEIEEPIQLSFAFMKEY